MLNQSTVGNALISKRRDHSNRLLIHNFERRLDVKEKMLYDPDITPEMREEFVKPFRKIQNRILAVIAVLIIIAVVWPHKPRPVPPLPKIESAGILKSLELHSGFFSATTVTTSTGIYQVAGGVSAAIGDAVLLKTEVVPAGTFQKLCFESNIKKACYKLF